MDGRSSEDTNAARERRTGEESKVTVVVWEGGGLGGYIGKQTEGAGRREPVRGAPP